MECEIRFVDLKLKKAFESLQTKDERLYKEISRALSQIKIDSFAGKHVRKKLIPKELIQKYSLNLAMILD